MSVHSLLKNGTWQQAENPVDTFQTENPATGETLPGEYPVSRFGELEQMLEAGREAARALRSVSPDVRAEFLDTFADNIEARADDLVEWAHRETALATAPRLSELELPRTVDQLRQAAATLAREANSVSSLTNHPWLLIPGFFIIISVLAFNFMGDALREKFDVGPGDRVAILAENRPEWIVTWWATVSLGAVAAARAGAAASASGCVRSPTSPEGAGHSMTCWAPSGPARTRASAATPHRRKLSTTTGSSPGTCR